jgi:hypothetical protein
MRVARRAAAITVLLVAASVVAWPPPARAADPSAESQFVARINSLRESKGLAPLQVDSELVGVARRWTDQMVGAGHISHNPNLAGDVDENWIKLGENVGVGANVDQLMNAFINSPEHYRNLVDPAYGYVGVGVSYDDQGRMYTTHNFMELAGEGYVTSPAKAGTPEPPALPPPPPPPPPPPTAPATPQRVHAVMAALHIADDDAAVTPPRRLHLR